jgi:glutamate N-acetyltransferase/amino-acid N-acetyltransferase
MIPKGFRAAARSSQMRYKDRLDVGLIVADNIQATAGIFTKNICQAAPILWSKPKISKGRAILVNAGQANAQTGDEGLNNCRLSAETLAQALNFTSDQILLASTGIIGVQLNMEPFLKTIPELVTDLSPDGFENFSRSIMTTDTIPKTVTKEISFSSGPPINIWGTVKGSGMIAPNMATMLAFLLTDAAVEPKLLQSLLSSTADKTFNRITIDGDTSTNDSLFLLASGLCSRPVITGEKEAHIFAQGLYEAMDSLARQLVFDGEGATHLIEIEIIGALNQAEALKAARTVAESPLVKTAFFGCDANWGRLLAALGRSGAQFDPYKVDINLDEVPWIRAGLDNNFEKEAAEVMKKREYKLSINLKAGSAEDRMLTCDFSHDYVSINGSYRS